MKTACMALALLTAQPACANPEWVRAKGAINAIEQPK